MAMKLPDSQGAARKTLGAFEPPASRNFIGPKEDEDPPKDGARTLLLHLLTLEVGKSLQDTR